MFTGKGQKGNALPVVLFFAAFGLITVSTYLAHHLASARLSYRSPSSLQALLNARSSVYKALQMLQDTGTADTLPLIDATDSMFNKNLFDKDTQAISLDSEEISFDNTPQRNKSF